MTEWIDRVDLPNGAQVVFNERTYRYFGDYNKIAISVQLCIPDSVLPASERMPVQSGEAPNVINYEVTILEQMAVPTGQLEAVRQSLIQGFMDTAGGYLKNENFIEKLMRKKTPVSAV